jgi:hypothetical protein
MNDNENSVEFLKSIMDFNKMVLGFSTTFLVVFLGFIRDQGESISWPTILCVIGILLSYVFALASFGMAASQLDTQSSKHKNTPTLRANIAAVLMIFSIVIAFLG